MSHSSSLSYLQKAPPNRKLDVNMDHLFALTTIIVAFYPLSLVLGETIGRVTIGPEVQNFCSVVHVQGADESWDNFALTFVQRDKKFPSNFLATVGNGLYSINSNGLATVLAGSDVRGNANGPSTSARFKLAAGLVQLSSNFILISDQKNQCIRQFNRTSGTVSQFAGRCNLIREYDSAF